MPPVDWTVEFNSCWKHCETVSAFEAVVDLFGEAPGGELRGKTSSLGLIAGEGVSAWYGWGAEERIASG